MFKKKPKKTVENWPTKYKEVNIPIWRMNADKKDSDVQLMLVNIPIFILSVYLVYKFVLMIWGMPGVIFLG